MHIFLIGGTGFTGPALVQQLLERGHEVTLLHRGQTHDARTGVAREIIADRKDQSQLPDYLQPKVNFEQDWDVDTQKIRARLGYSETVDVHEAFRRTVEWERANPPDVEPHECDYEQEDESSKK